MAFSALAFLALVLYITFRRAFIVSAMTDHLKAMASKPVDLVLLEEIKQEAVAYDLEEEFDKYIVGLKLKLGDQNIKNGHVLWVLDQLDAETPFCEEMVIPSL